MSRKTKKVLSFLIALLVVFIYTTYNSEVKKESYSKKVSNIVTTDLNVYYLDVGQADSILIRNNEFNMLIDAGNNEDGPKLVKFFKELGITHFDYVIGTHPHEDHIGGLDDIINNFEVKNIYMPEAYTTSKTFEDVLNSIDQNNLEITIPEAGDQFKLGEADLEVIYAGNDNDDLNNSSIVLKLIFGNHSYLFTGDATSETEEELIKKNIDIDVLKVAHHGSAYSTTTKFLEHVTPSHAIISVGKNNSYGHPSSATIERLKKYTSNIYETSSLGTILISSDGENLNINNFTTDTNG